MYERLIIRPATNDDAYRAQELRKLGWQDNYVYPQGGVTSEVLEERLAVMPPSDSDVNYFRETINKAENAGKLLVAEVAGLVVGVCFYETLENGNGDIGVFIDKSYRGQKIGSRLLGTLIEKTSNNLEVTIFSHNKSRNLYKQFRFVEAGEESIYYFDDNVFLPTQRLMLERV